MRTLMGIALVAFTVVMVGCSGGKYSDYKTAVERTGVSIDDFVKAIGDAKDAPTAIKAINRFADDMEAMRKTQMELSKKYPELAQSVLTEMPAELKEVQEKINVSMGKLLTVFTTLGANPVFAEPSVREAMNRLKGIEP